MQRYIGSSELLLECRALQKFYCNMFPMWRFQKLCKCMLIAFSFLYVCYSHYIKPYIFTHCYLVNMSSCLYYLNNTIYATWITALKSTMWSHHNLLEYSQLPAHRLLSSSYSKPCQTEKSLLHFWGNWRSSIQPAMSVGFTLLHSRSCLSRFSVCDAQLDSHLGEKRSPSHCSQEPFWVITNLGEKSAGLESLFKESKRLFL